jgi:outer membrane protein OmpA-like peptidoglycan-associated protein
MDIFDLVVLQAGDAFAFDKAELSEQGKDLLSQIVARHKNQYVARVYVTGYTDQIGNDEYNLKLSQRRADAAKAQLIADGIPADRIHTSAEGSADPLVACPGLGGEALIRCLAPNRRTEVRFVIPVVSTATMPHWETPTSSARTAPLTCNASALMSLPEAVVCWPV